MRSELSTTASTAINVGHREMRVELIEEWASRVIEFVEEARRPRLTASHAAHRLTAACYVRDELGSRLARSGESVADAHAARTLRDADARFVEFTVQSDTARAASWHNHYPQDRQWWWRRLPVAA